MTDTSFSFQLSSSELAELTAVFFGPHFEQLQNDNNGLEHSTNVTPIKIADEPERRTVQERLVAQGYLGKDENSYLYLAEDIYNLIGISSFPALRLRVSLGAKSKRSFIERDYCVSPGVTVIYTYHQDEKYDVTVTIDKLRPLAEINKILSGSAWISDSSEPIMLSRQKFAEIEGLVATRKKDEAAEKFRIAVNIDGADALAHAIVNPENRLLISLVQMFEQAPVVDSVTLIQADNRTWIVSEQIVHQNDIGTPSDTDTICFEQVTSEQLDQKLHHILAPINNLQSPSPAISKLG